MENKVTDNTALAIIQLSDTEINGGVDLLDYRYNFDEVKAIINMAMKTREEEVIRAVMEMDFERIIKNYIFNGVKK